MRLKRDIKVAGIQPETILGMMVARSVCEVEGYEFCVTSVREGTHMSGSKHYTGHAFDMRTRDMPDETKQRVRDDMAHRLGPDYDVVLESTHIHCEFDPK
jgi:hypothetical protein